jgi:hypothetical protein
MNSTPGLRSYGNAVQQPAAAQAGAAPRDARPNLRTHLFQDHIDKVLSEQAFFQSRGCTGNFLQSDEVTVLMRERDRLGPLCTDDASSLTLAEDLSNRVKTVLTAAAQSVRLTVVDYGARQEPSVAFHIHDQEMKRPQQHDIPVGPALPLAPSAHGPGQMAAWNVAEQTAAWHQATFKAHLRLALVNGNAPAVTTIMALLGDFELNSQQVVDIVALFDGRFPGLAWAMEGGQHASVSAYMSGLKLLDLSAQQIAGLVGLKDPAGFPGLWMALLGGHASMVTAFMDGLIGLELDRQQIADIVASRNLEEEPGLNMALSHGKAAAVTAFMRGLKGLDLAPSQIADLVAARSPQGLPGLHITLRNGWAVTVTAFMDGLVGLNLSPAQVGHIIQARSPDGVSGLGTARQHQQAAAVKAYMDGLTRLRRNHCVTPEQIAEIKAADPDSANCPIS